MSGLKFKGRGTGWSILSLAAVFAAFAIPWCLTSTTTAYEVDFNETVTFGDSLTHNDILGIVYGNPQDMYGMDPHEAVWDKGASTGNVLTNYAVAGSTSDDLSSQVDFYDFLRFLGTQDDATVIGFEIGGNDILDNVNLLANNAPGQNANADAVINGLIANIRSNFLNLFRTHPGGTRYIIWTLPDVTFVPRNFGQLNGQQQANLRAHLQRVNRIIRKAGRYKFIAVIDIYRVIQELAVNPPMIKGQQLKPTPTTGQYDAVFADEIHPTAVSNALLANIIITKLNKKWNDNIPLYSEDELAALARIQ